MSSCKAIFLLVSERSGSNLLRSLLDNHREIVAPIAPHLLNEFYSIRSYYGDLREPDNGRLLFQDMAGLADHPYHDWGLGMDLIQSSLKKYGPPSSVLQSIDRLYRLKADKEGKVHYASKGIHNLHHIDAIRGELSHARFLHLVRDPRDHVASWMKRPVGLYSPYDAIKKWVKEQEVFLDAIRSRGLSAKSIRYEELIEDTPTVMKNVLEVLGLEVDRACFDTDPDKGKELSWNPHWQNLAQPVMSNNKGKYKEAIDEEDLEMIETLSKDAMKAFGYPFETEASWQKTSYYDRKLAKQREEGKAKADAYKKESNPKLEDKIRYVKALKAERASAYRSPEAENGTGIFSNGFWRTRAEHLSKAFLGHRITERLKGRFN